MSKDTSIQLPGFVAHDSEAALPAHLKSDTGRGNEEIAAKDLAIPKINLVQKMSPQVDALNARAGQLHVSTTDQLLEFAYVVNLHYTRTFNVFKKRTLGGGFLGIFETSADAMAAIEETGHAKDYDIQETGTHQVLLLDENGAPVTPARIYMSGSKMKVSNGWNSTIVTRLEGADRFSGVWKLGSVLETSGTKSWHNFTVEFAGLCNEALHKEAEALYLGITSQAQREAA